MLKKKQAPAPSRPKRVARPFAQKAGKNKGITRSSVSKMVSKKSGPAKSKSLSGRIEALEERILKEKKELTELRRKTAPEKAADYVFKAHDGSEVRLSEMFGSHKDLILVHNMGRSCPYCTLWADGFTGLTNHLENRAGFVVISKDPVDMQREFYQSRGWNFKMYSSHDSTFNPDMKFEDEKGHQMPGVSAFFKDDSGNIYRASYRYFGPGDDFCGLWHMLDLLKEGANGWEPKYQY